MKKTIILSILIISILYCCKKDDCVSYPIDFYNMETNYGCTNTKYTLKAGVNNNDVTVIYTDADYDSQVSGECHPDINFDTYNLVIGRQSLTHKNDTIIYTYKRVCPDEVLTLTVDIIQTSQVLADTVVYHAIIPKLVKDENLNILVNMKIQ